MVASTITERFGPVTYLVRMNNRLTWKHHVDQLRSRPQSTDETAPETVSTDDYISAHTSITDAASENSCAPSPNAPTSRYPQRETRQPPDRLVYN